MGERKVLNKYIPPDFDPAVLPPGKRPENGQVTVRIMLPMSVQCDHCKYYVYKGKKFNAKKEEVKGGDYLGIKVWRFYFKCPHCLREITFVTDPQHGDYRVEGGAVRLFEAHRQEAAAQALLKRQQEEEEKGDSMKSLERRTVESRREMEQLDRLEELYEKSCHRETVEAVDPLAVLVEKKHSAERKEEKDEMAHFRHQQQEAKKKHARAEHTEEEEIDTPPSSSFFFSTLGSSSSSLLPERPSLPLLLSVKKKRKTCPTHQVTETLVTKTLVTKRQVSSE